MTAIEIARELLVRTRNIGTCIDSLAEPHRRVLDLRCGLLREPFTELDRATDVLSAELLSIERLLGQGMVDEAWSAVTVYEGRVSLLLPALRQLAGIRRGMRVMGAASASMELLAIEGMVLENDLPRAEEALRSFGPPGALPAPKLEARSAPGPGGRPCSICGRKVHADIDQCPFCGWEFGMPLGECPECGSTVLRSFRACPSCGKGLSSSDKEERSVVPLIIG